MASNPFDQFDEVRETPRPAAGNNPFDKFDASTKQADTPSGEWEKFSVPARPRQFVSPEDQPARMINPQKGTRQVPVASPGERAIYEAGGRVTDALTEAGLPPEAAAAGGYLTNVAGQLGSTFLGGRGGSKLEPAMQQVGKSLMQKALKPTMKELDTGQGQRAVDTMLKEGRTVSKGGIENMDRDIDILNKSIQESIANSKEVVNKFKVSTYAQKVMDDFKNQVNNAKDTETVRKAIKEFLDDPTIAQNIPVEVAQRLKQGTYRRLGEKAYNKEATTAQIGAEKALARGLKEEIAQKVPAVRPLNARESELINARDIAERAVLKEGNRDYAGLGMLTHSPAAGIGWMAERNPYLKSALAHYFYTHADPEMAGRVLGAGIGAYSGGAPTESQK